MLSCIDFESKRAVSDYLFHLLKVFTLQHTSNTKKPVTLQHTSNTNLLKLKKLSFLLNLAPKQEHVARANAHFTTTQR